MNPPATERQVPRTAVAAGGALKFPGLLALGFALLATAAWHPLPTGIWHDDGVYLLIAKSLASGDGLSYAGVPGSLPAAKFPPLYPLLLTPFWALGDDLAAGSGWVSALNVAFMAAATAVFCRFLMGAGWSAVRAASVSALAWCSPVLWRLTAIPLSEPVFLLFICLSLPAFARTRDGDGGQRGTPWWFVLAFGAAYLTRTAGIALLGAGVAASGLARRFGDAGKILVGGLMFVVPWSLWSGGATARIPEPLQDILGSYGGWLGGQILGDPGPYLGVVAGNLGQLLVGLHDALVPGGSLLPGLSPALGVLLALAVLRGVPGTWRLSPVAVLYPLGHTAILALWPYRSVRLLAPLVPFVLLMAAVGVGDTLKTLEHRRRVKWVLQGASGLFALQLAALSVWTVATGRHLAGYDIRARTLARAVEAIQATAPPDAVVGAPELWAALHLHTGRRVAPSARFLPLAPSGTTGGTPAQQLELWRAAAIDHLLVEHGGNVHGDALETLEKECGPESIQLLASFPGPGYLVRLELSPGCHLSH